MSTLAWWIDYECLGGHVLVFIYCDNISNIVLANNPFYHARMKHIEVHSHFVREKVLAIEVDLVYVSKWLASSHEVLGYIEILHIQELSWCT